MAWYNTSWPYRVKITIGSIGVGGLSDFPVYVDLSDLPTGFHSNVNTDGGDIRVTQSNGTTEVPREVVDYDDTGDTGELHFKGSTSPVSDTDFYIYYGNSGASDYATDATYGAENVWSDYEIVSHLGDDPTGSISDSTGNGNTASTGGSMTVGDITDNAPTGDGLSLDNNDYINYGNVGNPGTSDFSFSIWFKSTDSSGSALVAKSYLAGTDGRYYIIIRDAPTDSTLGFDTGGSDNVAFDTGALDNNWHLFHGVYDRSGNSEAFIDSSSQGTTDISGGSSFNFNQTNSLILGKYPTSAGVPYEDSANLNYIGVLSEFRLRHSVLSDEWVDVEYANQNDSSSFYTVSSQDILVAPNDIALGLSADATTINQDHDIATDDIDLSLSEDNTTIPQNYDIDVDDLNISLTMDNTTVDHNHILSPNDMALGLGIDATTITQIHDLTVQDIAMGLSMDATTITQNHIIVTQDIGLALLIDATTITQNHIITPEDIALSLFMESVPKWEKLPAIVDTDALPGSLNVGVASGSINTGDTEESISSKPNSGIIT